MANVAVLTSSQNLFHPRFKVFFPFGPQPAAFDGYSRLNAPHPIEKLPNVFAGPFLIYAPVFRKRHHRDEVCLVRVCRGSSLPFFEPEQTGMAGKKMFESRVNQEMAALLPDAAIEILSIAEDHQRLWLQVPAIMCGVVGPQIPESFGFIAAIAVDMLAGHFGYGCRAVIARPKVEFDNRRLSCIHSADDELCKTGSST